MVKVFTPTGKDSVSTRHIPTTDEDRSRDREQFKERKAEQDRIKDERFAKILEKRKVRKPSGGGGGINIKIGTD